MISELKENDELCSESGRQVFTYFKMLEDICQFYIDIIRQIL